jgi:hypothetical protein
MSGDLFYFLNARDLNQLAKQIIGKIGKREAA